MAYFFLAKADRMVLYLRNHLSTMNKINLDFISSELIYWNYHFLFIRGAYLIRRHSNAGIDSLYVDRCRYDPR